jgi:formylglycine-generating enzyme required for sulfatase activity
MAHDVFISYCTQDKLTADAACTALETAGIRCWIAPRDVPAGMSWPTAILDGIGRSRVMVLILSSHAIDSKEVQREVARACQKNVVVVPFRIEDVEPTGDMAYFMGTTHWLDALTPPLAAHFQRLCQTILALLPTLEGVSDPDPPGPLPPVASRDAEPSRQPSAEFAEQTKTAAVHEAAPPKTIAAFVGARAGQVRDDNSLKMNLVWIPPGEFTKGSPKEEKDRQGNEEPVQVSLTQGFWLGQYVVIQAEWERLMQTTPWSGNKYVKQGADYPAFVSWDEAMKFCEKLTQQERSARRLPPDWQYTLPTDAQWEYACRAGTKSRFSFGDDESDVGDYAWFDKNAGDAGEKNAHRVGQKKANPWGLSDMHGNVWEWCYDPLAEKPAVAMDPQPQSALLENAMDWWSDQITKKLTGPIAKKLTGGKDRQRPSRGPYRVARGGGWISAAGDCRSASRAWADPSSRGNNMGFRVALVPSAG